MKMMRMLKNLMWQGGTRKENQIPDHNFTHYVDDYCQDIEVDELAEFPAQAWKTLLREKKLNVARVNPLPESTPISSDKVRVVCLSDTHSKVEDSFTVPGGDVLLHAGDFTAGGSPEEVERFNAFLGKLPHKYKIVVAGNHDQCLDPDNQGPTRSFWKRFLPTSGEHQSYDSKAALNLLTNCIYLEDSAVELYGIQIYGSPWQPANRHSLHSRMAFKQDRGRDLLAKWNKIPEDTDILITHGPPIGLGDSIYGGFRSGCVDLLNTIQKRVRPKYHLYGHIHEGYGVLTDGYTVYINASTCTRWYVASNPPIVFDFPLPEGYTKDSLPVISRRAE